MKWEKKEREKEEENKNKKEKDGIPNRNSGYGKKALAGHGTPFWPLKNNEFVAVITSRRASRNLFFFFVVYYLSSLLIPPFFKKWIYKMDNNKPGAIHNDMYKHHIELHCTGLLCTGNDILPIATTSCYNNLVNRINVAVVSSGSCYCPFNYGPHNRSRTPGLHYTTRRRRPAVCLYSV